MNKHFLTEIQIKQFKCFSDFTAEGFKRVNLIGGKNNVGKTAFMEASFVNVFSSDVKHMISSMVQTKGRREKANLVHNKNAPDYQTFLDLIKSYETNSNINNQKFSVSEENAKKEYRFFIGQELVEVNANDINFSIVQIENINFIDNFGWADSILIRVFQAIQKQDKENELDDFIREFDGNIENFKVIGDKPQCKVNNKYRDLTEFGDGLKHYISIICALYACENGYLFIDEIDNGIHYTQLDRLWTLIFELSKKTNCQIFATTHSKEMLESFARVAKKIDEQDISYTTLVKNKQNEIVAVTRDYEMLLDSVEQNREVRGW